MIVRTATQFDVSSICAFARKMHAESNYGCDFNSVWFRKVLISAIKDPDHCVFCTWKDGELRGLLIGARMQQLFSPKYCATDLVFVAEVGGEKLLGMFVDWCHKNRVARIDMGNSQADRPGFDRFMAKHGMTRAGGLYYQNIVAPVMARGGAA